MHVVIGGVNMENSWWETDRKDNAAATAAHVKEPNAKHVITGVYAAFSEPMNGTLVIKEETTTKITLDVQGKINRSDLNIELDTNKNAVAELSASGTAGVYGSVLLLGYTK